MPAERYVQLKPTPDAQTPPSAGGTLLPFPTTEPWPDLPVAAELPAPPLEADGRIQVADLVEPQWYFNYELSWLDFNWRVLWQAMDPTAPLLDRVKFCAIVTSNLDEFFMKRVGGLKRQIAAGVSRQTPDGRLPQQTLAAISREVRKMMDELLRLWNGELQPALAEVGIRILKFSECTPAQQAQLCETFERMIYPTLTPLAVDPGHPFPFLSNLSLSLGVLVEDPDTGELHFARVKVPPNRPRFVQLQDGYHYVLLEDLIASQLPRLFPGMRIHSATPFRVTRNAQVERDEEQAEDLLEMIADELRERRVAPIVRLEIEEDMPQEALDRLVKALELTAEDVYPVYGPLDLTACLSLARLDVPEHQTPAWSPVVPPRLRSVGGEHSGDIFAEIRKKDLLVHHPYESFEQSVEHFVCTAAADPKVIAIKHTLYRTAEDSRMMQALIDAAQQGTEVAVLVEIKARFDEAANIEWVQRLEQAGVHVAYGIVGLKTHTKVCLIIREDEDCLRRYMHLGTGNYHPGTAKLYTDLSLFTCHPELADDVTDLFNFITGFAEQPQFRHLLVAPFNMRQRFQAMIQREIDAHAPEVPGRIMAKLNSLEDPALIRDLYRASQAGVQVRLFVRGVCRLRPGIPGLSEHIRVTSILGQFLEHSRIYYFQNQGADEYYIGSADWMHRNLDSRVETIVPILDPDLKAKLARILDVCEQDNRLAWDLQANGRYVLRRPGPDEPERASQALLMTEALGT